MNVEKLRDIASFLLLAEQKYRIGTPLGEIDAIFRQRQKHLMSAADGISTLSYAQQLDKLKEALGGFDAELTKARKQLLQQIGGEHFYGSKLLERIKKESQTFMPQRGRLFLSS